MGLRDWRAVWDGRYLYSPEPYNILYDHKTDPYETTNLVGSPEHEADQKRMHDLLVLLAKNNGDPMCEQLRTMTLSNRSGEPVEKIKKSKKNKKAKKTASSAPEE